MGKHTAISMTMYQDYSDRGIRMAEILKAAEIDIEETYVSDYEGPAVKYGNTFYHYPETVQSLVDALRASGTID